MSPTKIQADNALNRDLTLNIRARRAQLALIDEAAALLGKSRSDLMQSAPRRCYWKSASLLKRRRFRTFRGNTGGYAAFGKSWPESAAKSKRHGIGATLLQDALLRTIQVSEIAGMKAILVHAISGQAAEYYKKWGFHPSPVNPNTLFLSIRQAKELLRS